MRFRLRTLLIVLALGPPVLAWVWWAWERFRPGPTATLPSDLDAYPVGDLVLPVVESEYLFDPGGPPTMREDWSESQP